MTVDKDLSGFEAVLHDLKKVLIQEKEMILYADRDTFELLTIKKLQFLGKLGRYSGSDLLSSMPAHIVREIEEVDSLLSSNSKVLRLKIDALTEVSKTISQAIEDTQSDGTYSFPGRP